jgi:hypothetical protein
MIVESSPIPHFIEADDYNLQGRRVSQVVKKVKGRVMYRAICKPTVLRRRAGGECHPF